MNTPDQKPGQQLALKMFGELLNRGKSPEEVQQIFIKGLKSDELKGFARQFGADDDTFKTLENIVRVLDEVKK